MVSISVAEEELEELDLDDELEEDALELEELEELDLLEELEELASALVEEVAVSLEELELSGAANAPEAKHNVANARHTTKAIARKRNLLRESVALLVFVCILSSF